MMAVARDVFYQRRLVRQVLEKKEGPNHHFTCPSYIQAQLLQRTLGGATYGNDI